MMRLITAPEIEDAHRRLAGLLDMRAVWLCTEQCGGVTSELRRGDWELRAMRGALHFSFKGEDGAHIWRITAWEQSGEKLLLEASGRAGAVRTTLELVARTSASEAKALLVAARRSKCRHLATLACAMMAGARIESATLSRGARRGEPGRYARILLKLPRGLLAATAPVVDLGREDADAFLSSALLWFARLCERKRAPVPQKLLLIATPRLCEATRERLALLGTELKRVIEICEIDDDSHALVRRCTPELNDLLSVAPRFRRPVEARPGPLAAQIVALAPGAIDVVRARRGETLRFHGLPFARVRRLMDRENAWFGIEGASKRRLLDAGNWPELLKLVEELRAHRRAEGGDRRHALYRALPESWLESILRRDITRLDPGLIVSPLHAQFRTSHERRRGARPLDLLALRRDGRLVVIELKVSEDAALALQGADYWRRITAHQRAGHLMRARLFGDARILHEPPLVYLVAPLLRFHPAFHMLARAIDPRIEMYRFDLNEDWRTCVKVMRRGDLA